MSTVTGNDIANAFLKRIKTEGGIISKNQSSTEYYIKLDMGNRRYGNVREVKYADRKTFDYFLTIEYPWIGEREINCTNGKAKKIFNLLKEKLECV